MDEPAQKIPGLEQAPKVPGLEPAGQQKPPVKFEYKYKIDFKMDGNPIKKLAGGCGTVVAFCVIVLVILIGGFTWLVNPKTITDPNLVEAKAREVLEFDIPGGVIGLIAKKAWDCDMILVASTGTPPGVIISMGVGPILSESGGLIAKFKRFYLGNFQRNAVFETRNKYWDIRNGGKGIAAKKMETSTGTICGGRVDIQFIQGTADTKSGEMPMAICQTRLKVNGRMIYAGVTTLGIGCDEKAKAVFNSLRCK